MADKFPASLSLYTITAVLILVPGTGERVYVNYYKPPHGLPDGSDIKTFQPYLTKKEQLAFEKGLCEKTNKQNHEVLMYDDKLVIYKHEGDVCLYVVGGQEENELMLYSVLAAIKDALNIVLKSSIDKRTINEHYDQVAITIDETIDDGIILETDPQLIASRVSKPPKDELQGVKSIELSEQGLLNAWELGKRQLQERLRQGF